MKNEKANSKGFIEKHKDAIESAVFTFATIYVCTIIGYKLGERTCMKGIAFDLHQLFKVDPELRARMWSAIAKVNNN